jgi:hypothetical protein
MQSRQGMVDLWVQELQIRPAGEKGDALAIGGSSTKLLKTHTDIVIL